jgi:hypothetical protein
MEASGDNNVKIQKLNMVTNQKLGTESQNYCVFLDSVYRPVFWKTGNTMFRKLDLFPSSGEAGENTHSVGSLRRS